MSILTFPLRVAKLKDKLGATKKNLNLLMHVTRTVDSRDLGVFSGAAKEYKSQKSEMEGWEVLSATLELTYQSNRRCAGCYVPNYLKPNLKTMSNDLALRAIEECNENGVVLPGFAGGEPLLPKPRELMVNLLEKYPKLPFFVFTNGDALANGIGELADFHNLAYLVSIDGKEIDNDYFRGTNSFNNVLSAFENLRDNKKFYGASVTIRKSTLEGITDPAFFDLLAEQGVSVIRCRPLRNPSDPNSPNEEQAKYAKETLTANARKYPFVFDFEESYTSRYPLPHIVIDMHGGVRTSRLNMDEPLGNLYEENLGNIIKRVNKVF